MVAPHRLLLADVGHRPGRERAEPLERGDGRRAADRIGRDARVALELPERGFGLRAENAVLAARIEAERVEPALQDPDIVAAQHRPAQVQQPVAQAERALDQRAPGLGSADAVDEEPARVLERPHRVLGRGVERAGGADRTAGAIQPVLELEDGGAARSESQQRPVHLAVPRPGRRLSR